MDNAGTALRKQSPYPPIGLSGVGARRNQRPEGRMSQIARQDPGLQSLPRLLVRVVAERRVDGDKRVGCYSYSP
jgi:hypothetical protein